jgi:hypothetical protein
MKVKCALCGEKGYYDIDKVSEFYAGQFKMINTHKYKGFVNPKNIKHICRLCIQEVLDAIRMEQYNIDKLHHPDIRKR